MQVGISVQAQEPHGILYTGCIAGRITVSVIAALAGALTIGGALGNAPPSIGTNNGTAWVIPAGTAPGLYTLAVQSGGSFSYSYAVAADTVVTLLGVN